MQPQAGILRTTTFNIAKLNSEVEALRTHPELKDLIQISLRHRKGSSDPWREGAGSLWSPLEQRAWAHEAEFTELHAALKGSEIEKVSLQMMQSSGFQIGRLRILILPARRCYSFHKDTELRFHLPLVTSDQSVFLFANRPPLHFPADGRIYWADTRVGHSAMNGHSTQERIHLVASVLESSDMTFERFIQQQELASMPPGTESPPARA